MSDADDFYQILEVQRGCSEADIKKAYRRLAIKWHPDKNPNNVEQAESMFKLVSRAYEVLSSPEQRQIYDQYGLQGLEGGGGARASRPHAGMPDDFSFRHAQDIFSAFFGGRDPFSDPFFTGHGTNDVFSSMMGGGFPSMMGGGRGFQSMMGGGGGCCSFSSSSIGGGFSSSSSVSTSTTIENGVRVTRKQTTMVDANGNSQTTVEEERHGADGQMTRRVLQGQEAQAQIQQQQQSFGGFDAFDSFGGFGGFGGFRGSSSHFGGNRRLF